MKRPKAFTLIELLVVISIIALLLSILMPSLQKVKKQAQKISCLSNLRQVGTGMILYTAEYKQKLMEIQFISMTINGVQHPYKYWLQQLAPYMGDMHFNTSGADLKNAMKVGLCAAASRYDENEYRGMFGRGGRGTHNTAWKDERGVIGSFALNLWVTTGDVGIRDVDYQPKYSHNFFHKFSEVKHNTPLFGDSVVHGAYPMDTEGWSPDCWPTGSRTFFHRPYSWQPVPNVVNQYQMGRFQIDRHSKAVDIGFADGHAATVDLVNLWAYPWHKGFRTISVKPMPAQAL